MPIAAPRRALVVEDEAIIAMLIEEYLHEIGIAEVSLAATLPAGLAAAKTAAFDLSVLDVNLKGARSDEIASVLIGRGIPFLFLTGYGPDGLTGRFARYPVLTKPLQFAELKREVDRLLDPRRATAMTRQWATGGPGKTRA